MTTLARPAAIVNDRPIISSEKKLHKENKMLVVSLKGLVAKMNSLAVIHQS
jgi:hypothetical protein